MLVELKHFEVRVEAFHSPALQGNPAGDPATRRLPVFVPRASGRFPVIFVLAGFAGSGRQFLNSTAWVPTFPERLDRLREQGRLGDVIVVCPDAFTVYGGSQYLNSTATGRYEDMIVQDLVTWVDERYPSLPGARHRGIVGKSSGGYGALMLGMRHADVFGAVACHSGDMYFDYVYRHDLPKLLRQLDKYGSLDGFMKAFFAAPKKTSELVLAMNLVAMAAAYSPNPGAPWRVDLPVDPPTGELRADVWERWLAHDPVHLCARHVESLKSLRLLYLDCGRQDQFLLQYGLRILRRKLAEQGIPHLAEEFDDDHSDTGYRYEESLPRLWQALRP